jgi:hypothetical protein
MGIDVVALHRLSSAAHARPNSGSDRGGATRPGNSQFCSAGEIKSRRAKGRSSAHLRRKTEL